MCPEIDTTNVNRDTNLRDEVDSRRGLQIVVTPAQEYDRPVEPRPRPRISITATEPLDSRPFVTQQAPAIGTSTGAPDGPDAWAHLLRWEEDADNESIDLNQLDDTDAEEEDVEEDEGMLDMEDAGGLQLDPSPPQVHFASQPGRPQQRSLPQDVVVDVINQEIEHYTNIWYPGKDEPGARSRETLLQSARGDRQELVSRHQAEIRSFQHRLDEIGEEILKANFRSEANVRHACRNLETTVDLIQDAEWRIALYEGTLPETPPSRAGNRTKHNSVGQLPSLPSVVIDLESDSDILPMLPDTHDQVGNTTLVATRADHPIGLPLPIRAPISRPEPTASQTSLAGSSIGVVAANRGDARAAISAPGIVDLSTNRTPLDNRPGEASMLAVSKWSWSHLLAKGDRKRIIMKVIHEMPGHTREMIRARFDSYSKQNSLADVAACVNMFAQNVDKLPDVPPQELGELIVITKLFLCWWLADDYSTYKIATNAQMVELADCVRRGVSDLSVFHDWVRYVLSNTFSREALQTPFAPSQAEIICISDDD